jgi:hypothetical protein
MPVIAALCPVAFSAPKPRGYPNHRPPVKDRTMNGMIVAVRKWLRQKHLRKMLL